MKQKRLEAICAFLDANDRLIDVGCDHGYVAIEMAKRGCSKILASDIHEGALKSAEQNIKKNNLEKTIETVLSDGLSDIDVKAYNTLVIAGMGASTILHILSDKKKLENITKIILQSNNDLAMIREYMQTHDFFLEEETIIQEKKHYYVILKYRKGKQFLTETEIYFGLYKRENQEYYRFLEKKYQEILKKTSNIQVQREYELLQNYL